MLNNLYKIKSKFAAEVTAVPAVFQDSYYQSLNGLRGISILMVMLAHFGLNRIFKSYYPVIYGSTGVHIFFVLSGFLITTLLIKEKVKTGNISIKMFYVRRILRIIPAVYLFLLVVIILNLYYKFKIPTADFVYSFLFLKNMPVQNIPLTAHLWTLAVEMQFYAVFPFLLTLSLNKYLVFALSIIVAIFGVSLVDLFHPAWLSINPVIHQLAKVMLYAFWKGPFLILIGSVSSVLLFKGFIKIGRKRNTYFLSFILFLTAILIQSPGLIFYVRYISEFISACLVAYVILLSISGTDLLSVILKNTILVQTGILSYGLYIWQELFLGGSVWQPWLKSWAGLPSLVIIILKLLCVFIIAGVSYYFFESKFLKLKNRFK